jgi:outer membrane receptor for ferrienterochelin and colicin
MKNNINDMIFSSRDPCLCLFAAVVFYMLPLIAFAAEDDLTLESIEEMSLEELFDAEVITPSLRGQRASQAPANIHVITQEQIRQRAYKNLFEVLVDVPGFDFSTFEDGGGEYPSHSIHRGLGGDTGNTKLLIMVDGIVQNHSAELLKMASLEKK